MLPAPVNTLYAAEQAVSSSSPAISNESATAVTTKDKVTAPKRKKRKLSAFFKLGIAINIAMIFTFLWWASRQWRMTAKNEEP